MPLFVKPWRHSRRSTRRCSRKAKVACGIAGPVLCDVSEGASSTCGRDQRTRADRRRASSVQPRNTCFITRTASPRLSAE